MTAIKIDPELVKQYARVKNISEEEAHKRLEENMVKEAVEVDLRQQYQVLINAFRKMQPQLQGVVLRESDTNLKLMDLDNRMKELIAKLEFERETYAKSMKILNDIVKVDHETMERIKKLEDALNTSFYQKVLNKIKWMLKR
jgi:hypothetical protein